MCVCVCNHDCAYKRYCCFKIGRTKSVLKMFEVKQFSLTLALQSAYFSTITVEIA